ncbi:MAG: acyl-CoA thioesterase [Deltaproteobacteria bacterium]|nr:acyl-CoA thioesterase [Deltaproteobacteria bacterium]MBW2677225.1 acyl-CoA thioesterase [Deltaproteobacteria bacterium]
MEAKTVANSSVIMRHMVSQQDANLAGIMHGGVVMKHIDDAAGVVAIKHTGSNVVTASIDRLDFHHPVLIGNLLTIKACINMVGKSSMEIGVRVEAEDIISQKIRHTASAYLTFVALDENNRPSSAPPLEILTTDEKRRNREAMDRKQVRLAEKTKEKACRENKPTC